MPPIERIWLKKTYRLLGYRPNFQPLMYLFPVIYRSEVYSPNFFTNLQDVMEKAWMKTDNNFLLGDLNCNFLGVN